MTISYVNGVMIFLYAVTLPATLCSGRSSYFDSWSREDMVRMAGYGEEKLSTVIVSGSVLCETRFDDHKDDSRRSIWPINGASIAVECGREGERNETNIYTDEYGYFAIDLPSELHAISNLENECCVKVLSVPVDSECSSSSFTQKHKNLKLTSSRNGFRRFSAGEIRIQESPEKSADSSYTRIITGQNHGKEQFK